MVAVPSTVHESWREEEHRLLLRGVSWAQYEQLLAVFPESQGNLHITYLEGVVELMTTGPRHEQRAARIARLIDAWSEEMEIELVAYRSTTFRRQAAERGLEPDDSYTIGQRPADADEMIDRPDIAVEVVVSSPLLDKLAVYAGLGVPEVWVWRDGVFTPHVLGDGRYDSRASSALLPRFDFALVAELIELPSQLEAVKTLRRTLRGGDR